MVNVARIVLSSSVAIVSSEIMIAELALVMLAFFRMDS